jgi:hypothetical protein
MPDQFLRPMAPAHYAPMVATLSEEMTQPAQTAHQLAPAAPSQPAIAPAMLASNPTAQTAPPAPTTHTPMEI